MILDKLEQAKKIELLIIDQQTALKFFEMGVISKISVRKFNDLDCRFEDKDFTTNIPRKILKNAMLDFLKKDIENLNHKLSNLFKDEN
jgi:hypothetical protein